MIHEVEGDILLTRAKSIAHGVSPSDDFKAGLALSLREMWPAMYKDFRHYCQTENPKEGTLWVWQGTQGPKLINLLTQQRPPRAGAHPGKASLENVGHCLKELRKYVLSEKVPSLAITKLATGVGGLDWPEVKALVVRNLGDLDIPVYVYSTYVKGAQAKEN